jgi:hypothetical protein
MFFISGQLDFALLEEGTGIHTTGMPCFNLA